MCNCGHGWASHETVRVSAELAWDGNASADGNATADGWDEGGNSTGWDDEGDEEALEQAAPLSFVEIDAHVNEAARSPKAASRLGFSSL